VSCNVAGRTATLAALEVKPSCDAGLRCTEAQPKDAWQLDRYGSASGELAGPGTSPGDGTGAPVSPRDEKPSVTIRLSGAVRGFGTGLAWAGLDIPAATLPL
jgi:hypothetical protein